MIPFSKVAKQIVECATAKNIKIATAESCTGGMIASAITSVSGSSSVFEIGVVTYANRFKAKILNIDEILLKRHGAVSAEVAQAMAEGIGKLSGAEIALSVTGIAGPAGGSIDKPVGTVFIGIVVNGKPKVLQALFEGTREEIRTTTTDYALELISNACMNY